VTITGLTAQSSTYNGETHSGYNGMPSSSYTGDYEIAYTGRNGTTYTGTTPPRDAGNYTVTFQVPGSDLDYYGSTSVDFIIGKATVTATADSKSMTTGSTLPAFTVSYSGIASGDTASSIFAAKATASCTADGATAVDVNLCAGGSKVSTFGDGKITVSVPYTLKPGENTDSITVWFINDDGTIELKPANYANGKVTFVTDHLSRYLIVDFPFADVTESAWYYGSVAYAYDNDLFSGTSVSPNAAANRQMLWMVLACMDNGTPAEMAAARTWAMENGISDGSNPTDVITREQLAAVLYRYAQYKNYDVTAGKETDILRYDDALTIHAYAVPALQWACGAGLMQGSDNRIMPSKSATRAQVATILQRFCRNAAE
jgi:hypothetical protein